MTTSRVTAYSGNVTNRSEPATGPHRGASGSPPGRRFDAIPVAADRLRPLPDESAPPGTRVDPAREPVPRHARQDAGAEQRRRGAKQLEHLRQPSPDPWLPGGDPHHRCEVTPGESRDPALGRFGRSSPRLWRSARRRRSPAPDDAGSPDPDLACGGRPSATSHPGPRPRVPRRSSPDRRPGLTRRRRPPRATTPSGKRLRRW
jgi:hypothetical protein